MKLKLTNTLSEYDTDINEAIQIELNRQKNQLELIASENIVSKAVMEAQGSILTNKYAEGYPGKRYYNGCEAVDKIEMLAIQRLTKLFDCKFANVQPNSGSQANQAVFTALIKPGDTILSQSLDAGGHLTHGASVSQSGKWFDVVQYGLRAQDGLLDYQQMFSLAKKHKPKLIIGGFSSYSRIVDWTKYREIADEVGAYLLVDMAHIAGLVAGGVYPSPVPYADVVTSTTHKTLRGPRGGIVLTNDEKLIKKINSAVFPGIQGGPLMHIIAAKAVCFKEALQDEFKIYAQQVVDNAKILAKTIMDRGYDVPSKGTDNHIVLLSFVKEGLLGNQVADILDLAGITCNKNAVANDPQPPMKTSGIRLGTAAITTRGLKEIEVKMIGEWICDIIDTVKLDDKENIDEKVNDVKNKTKELCLKFPIY